VRFIAVTFFVLAGYVVVEGLCDLVTGAAPDTSRVGIALAGASIVIMPWLAWAKHRAGQAMGSRLILVDAAETRLCAWAVGVDVRGSGRRRRARVDVDRRGRRVRHRGLRGRRGAAMLGGRAGRRRLTGPSSCLSGLLTVRTWRQRVAPPSGCTGCGATSASSPAPSSPAVLDHAVGRYGRWSLLRSRRARLDRCGGVGSRRGRDRRGPSGAVVAAAFAGEPAAHRTHGRAPVGPRGS